MRKCNASKTRICAWAAIGAAVFAVALIVTVSLSPKIIKHFAWKMAVRDIRSYCSSHDEMRRFYVSDGCCSPNAYIAHGGGIGDYVYTNSAEAVRDSIEKGFKFVEIDMQVTADGHIVGVHAWSQYADFTGVDIDPETVTLNQIKWAKIKGKYTLLEGKDIARIMKENNDLILVTDKICNYDLLLHEIPYPDRMIVEVFTVEDYAKAIRAGVKYPAFSMWNTSDVTVVESLQIPIVTMNACDFFKDEASIALVQRLHDKGVTILLFSPGPTSWWDSENFVRKYLGRTASKIYTDKWSPSNTP